MSSFGVVVRSVIFHWLVPRFLSISLRFCAFHNFFHDFIRSIWFRPYVPWFRSAFDISMIFSFVRSIWFRAVVPYRFVRYFERFTRFFSLVRPMISFSDYFHFFRSFVRSTIFCCCTYDYDFAKVKLLIFHSIWFLVLSFHYFFVRYSVRPLAAAINKYFPLRCLQRLGGADRPWGHWARTFRGGHRQGITSTPQIHDSSMVAVPL